MVEVIELFFSDWSTIVLGSIEWADELPELLAPARSDCLAPHASPITHRCLCSG
jgi:hypothetical protein